ncbi:hypothetical protein [Planotetraspora silvatica]|nr:hypothetical protein [Planotetraspora silvatica]
MTSGGSTRATQRASVPVEVRPVTVTLGVRKVLVRRRPAPGAGRKE